LTASFPQIRRAATTSGARMLGVTILTGVGTTSDRLEAPAAMDDAAAEEASNEAAGSGCSAAS
jgi:hypothetical protein